LTHTASADFCPPIPSLFNDGSTWQDDRSPRVRRATFVPCARHIYFYIFPVIIGLWILWPPRPGVAASYALRVPQAEDLPTASSRPHLTMIALAVRLTVPVIRVRRGLSPPNECALPGAPTKKPVSLSAKRAHLFYHRQQQHCTTAALFPN
jgi:hypothetical protein